MEMQVFFERREEIAPTIWHYYFRPERPVDFVAGQYAEFSLLQPILDPRGQSRTFTLTSLPTDPMLSFVGKFTAPLSPYKQALQALTPGTPLRMGDTMGDQVLPKSLDQPLVFIAGGIGMASYASMLALLTTQREERSIFLFYALRTRREQIFTNLTATYPLQLRHTTIAPHRLTADEVLAATPPDALVYISGSQSFVEAMRADLEHLGTPRENIVFDYYDGYAQL